MKIGGFQKLTLLDYPGKMSCIVFTAGCNFRCRYCHNFPLLEKDHPLTVPETVMDYLQKRRNILDCVVISGGEPLIQPDTLPFLKELKSMGYSVKLDTNGSFPDLLEKILEDDLADYIAMDVKNAPERYTETIGVPQFSQEKITRSITILKNSQIGHEFRTTLVKQFQSEIEIERIACLLEGGKVWYLQPFRDAPGVPDHGLLAPDADELSSFGSIGNRYIKTIIRQ